MILKSNQSVCFYSTAMYNRIKVQAKEEGGVESIYMRSGFDKLDGLVATVNVNRLKKTVAIHAEVALLGPLTMVYLNLMDSSASTVHSCQGFYSQTRLSRRVFGRH